jgi:hypothetical protein
MTGMRVPQCTRTLYDSGDLWIVNSCNIAVVVEFTSDSGNTWGTTNVGPSNRVMVESMGFYDPRKDGTVYLFACPSESTAEMPNGSPWLPGNYKGQYTCAQQ